MFNPLINNFQSGAVVKNKSHPYFFPHSIPPN